MGGNPKKKSAPPRNPNAKTKSTLGPTFAVRIVERMYDGSARWGDRDKLKIHTRAGDTTAREYDVRKAMEDAHEMPSTYTRAYLLRACLNPDCPGHPAEVCEFPQYMNLARPSDEERAMLEKVQKAKKDLVRLSRGEMDSIRKDGGVCPECNKVLPAFAVRPLENRFIYVLAEVGPESLEVRYEIQALGSQDWFYMEFRKGDEKKKGPDRWNDMSRIRESGGLLELPHASKQPWHFFVSPVQLGPRSLEMLMKAPKLASDAAAAFRKELVDAEKKAVPAEWSMQPFCPTVRLKFSEKEVLARKEQLFVPVIDPFSWAFWINDMDYGAALVAQHNLHRNENEQHKLFIASIYNSVISVKVDDDSKENDKVKVEKDPDPHGIKNELVNPNVARHWVKRYQNAQNYLAAQTNNACARLVNFIKHSVAHRIVELSCQEHGDSPGFLAHGLLHWHNLLREMHGCSRGLAYLSELVEKRKEHIPVRNVLNHEGLGKDSKVLAELGNQVPLEIYALLSPIVIRMKESPLNAVKADLEALGAPSAPGMGEIKTFTETSFEIVEGACDGYLKKITGQTEKGISRALSGKEFFQLFTELKQVETVINLFLSLGKWSKEGKEGETYYDAYGRMKGKAEIPLKFATFLTKRANDIVKAGAKQDLSLIIKKWDDVNVGIGDNMATLMKKANLTEAEIALASQTKHLKVYTFFGKVGKVLTGPVNLVLGGCDFIVESRQTVVDWRNGDPGSAWGHALLGGAAALSVIAAGAEIAALASGSVVAGWVPVVGWIAVALTLGAAVVLYAFAKRPLELHALHCFFGREYGKGDWDEDVVYLGKRTWPSLRWTAGAKGLPEATRANMLKIHPERYEDSQRYRIQRETLLNMLTSYEVRHHTVADDRGTIWIFAPFAPPTAVFEIEMDMWPLKGRDGPDAGGKYTVKARVWFQDGSCRYLTKEPEEGGVTHYPSDNGGAKIRVRWPNPPGMPRSSWARWTARVRMDMTGEGQQFNPLSGTQVKLVSTKITLGIVKVSSAETA